MSEKTAPSSPVISDPKYSVTVGSFIGTIDFEEWPPSHYLSAVHSMILSDGEFWLHANSLGQLTAHLLAPGAVKPGGELDPRGLIRRCTSCPSRAESSPVALFIAVTWTETTLKIYLQGRLVASTDGADQPAPFVSVEPQPKLYSGPMQDFSKENEEALRKRSGVFAGHQPRPGRQVGDAAYLLEQLRLSLSRLNTHIALVSEGKFEHAVDIAGALRVLVADNNRRPMLQQCAAIFERPLIVFTHPHPNRPWPGGVPKPDVQLETNIAIEPSAVVDVNPVDIDVWLDLPGGRLQGKPFTNKDFIQQVANTIAQHVDRNIHPYVTLLRSSKVSVDGQGGELLASYFLRLGRVVARLAGFVLSEAPANAGSIAKEDPPV